MSDQMKFNPPTDGDFSIGYLPFWLRLSVIAHDGNGTPSVFGAHAHSHYLVLHANLKSPLNSLSRIPISP